MSEAMDTERRAMWILHDELGFIECSECNKGFSITPSNYCPNCGARMEVDIHENE